MQGLALCSMLIIITIIIIIIIIIIITSLLLLLLLRFGSVLDAYCPDDGPVKQMVVDTSRGHYSPQTGQSMPMPSYGRDAMPSQLLKLL